MDLQIKEISSREKGKVQLVFDNGMRIILYKGEMRKLSLKEGATVTEATYRMIMEEIIGKRAIKRAMHLLERQERTEKQLYDKLKQNGYPEECIENAIGYVRSYHYIDDLRYAKTYIRYHQDKKSYRKLQMDLMSKGVPENLIEQALEEEFESDEVRKICGLLQKRHYQKQTADDGEKRRTFQFLARRGFQSSDILKAMQEHESE